MFSKKESSQIIDDDSTHSLPKSLSFSRGEPSLKLSQNEDIITNNTLDEIHKLINMLDDSDIKSLYLVQSMVDDKLKSKQKYEVLLDSKFKKFTIHPITYPRIWKCYKDQVASFWKAEEIDFSNDHKDFMTLNPNEQYFIKKILAFFASSDGIVVCNLSNRFIKEIQITEVAVTYEFQTMMENIHGEVYSLQLESLVTDQNERNMLFNAIETDESIKLMSDWAFKWIDSSESISYRIIAFIIFEGIFFSGAFAAIFWIKKYKNKGASKGKPFMDGLIKSNKFISRDESQHGLFGCEVYNLLENKLNQLEINNIFSEGVDIAIRFMCDALPVNLIGMNSDMMSDYIKYIADRWIVTLGYNKMYNTQNPFKFMETMGMIDKTNFFESRPHEYQDAFINNNNTQSEVTFDNFDEDF